MKRKKLILLLLLLVPTFKIRAETFWSDKKIDAKLIREETRYKFYKEEIIGEYLEKNKKYEKYDYEDENDLIYSEYSEYKENCDENNDVVTKVVHPYKKIRKSKFVTITPMKDTITYKTFTLYINEKEVFKKEINKTLAPNEELTIEFDKEYETCAIKIKLTNENKTLVFASAFFKDVNKKPTYRLFVNTNNLTYNLNNPGVNPPDILGDTYYSESPLEPSIDIYIMKGKEKEMCKERKIYTYHYNIKRNYYDNEYHVSVDKIGYIKSMDEKKVFYEYQSTDKTKQITNSTDASKIKNTTTNNNTIKEDAEDNSASITKKEIEDKQESINKKEVLKSNNDKKTKTNAATRSLKETQKNSVIKIILFSLPSIIILIILIIKLLKNKSNDNFS